MLQVDVKVLVAAVLTAVAIWAAFARGRRDKLPPLVKGYPVIGSLVDMAKAGSAGTLHLLMQRWSQRYGAIYRVKVGFTEVSNRQ
jgi:hypothetical protein